MMIKTKLQPYNYNYNSYNNTFKSNKRKNNTELNNSKASDLNDVSTALLLLSLPFVMSTFNKNKKYNRKDYFGIFLLASSMIFAVSNSVKKYTQKMNNNS